MGAAARDIMTTLPRIAGARLTAGLDWAKDDHAVSVVDDTGREIHRFTVTHTAAGMRELVRRLRTTGVEEVAIERARTVRSSIGSWKHRSSWW